MTFPPTLGDTVLACIFDETHAAIVMIPGVVDGYRVTRGGPVDGVREVIVQRQDGSTLAVPPEQLVENHPKYGLLGLGDTIPAMLKRLGVFEPEEDPAVIEETLALGGVS